MDRKKKPARGAGRSEYNDIVLRNNVRQDNRLRREQTTIERGQKVIAAELHRERRNLLQNKARYNIKPSSSYSRHISPLMPTTTSLMARLVRYDVKPDPLVKAKASHVIMKSDNRNEDPTERNETVDSNKTQETNTPPDTATLNEKGNSMPPVTKEITMTTIKNKKTNGVSRLKFAKPKDLKIALPKESDAILKISDENHNAKSQIEAKEKEESYQSSRNPKRSREEFWRALSTPKKASHVRAVREKLHNEFNVERATSSGRLLDRRHTLGSPTLEADLAVFSRTYSAKNREIVQNKNTKERSLNKTFDEMSLNVSWPRTTRTLTPLSFKADQAL